MSRGHVGLRLLSLADTRLNPRTHIRYLKWPGVLELSVINKHLSHHPSTILLWLVAPWALLVSILWDRERVRGGAFKCISVYMYLCIYVHMYIYIYVHTYHHAYMVSCTCVCMYTHSTINICIYVRTHTYIYIYVHVYIYIVCVWKREY